MRFFTKTLKKASWYKNISELPLDRFIKVVCENDLLALTISGRPTEAELNEAWEEIYDEYVFYLKDKTQEYFESLTRTHNILLTKIQAVDLVIYRLSIQHSDEIVKELKKLLPGLSGKFNAQDVEGYRKDLKKAQQDAKILIAQADQKKQELEKLIEQRNGEKIDRTQFDKMLIQISKHMKYHINKYTVTVSEFINMILDINETMELLEKTK